MVVRLASTGERGEVLRQKLEAIGYGFLVPFFFVVSGIKFDFGSLLESTRWWAQAWCRCSCSRCSRCASAPALFAGERVAGTAKTLCSPLGGRGSALRALLQAQPEPDQ